ncbi:M56 family metallopeptidase [Streptomyces murinus]|uniref:Zn-dependent protease with chaperone function n=1 Tax=Streptomyces murinus TaxID=33900 RepID=A0A7W3NWN0_STRMR|nr:M56 family metallopeptidase [Streptomyces murinus]MBA9057997.1 Zn-dependent protease with chaperone function [Streptomyces murinus]UWW92218.1 M48 family metalloprotease [Streptomyces murinus]WSI89528.1 M56 family metallopeptidase [Streptomyces murinus]
MRFDVYSPLALSLLLAAAGPLTGRYVAPAAAARVLAAAAVVTAGATTWSLVLLGAALLGDVPPVVRAAGQGGAAADPVPVVIGLAACLALVVVGVRLHRAVRAERRTRRALRLLCAGQPADTELIVAASAVPRACAVPGRPGRILVTSAMLGALGPAERRALLAHERAHLAHRHDVLVTAATLAAAADPLLCPVRSTVVYLVERWADERAAAAVGDRRTTAHALARAALTAQRGGAVCALHFADRAVTRRIAALQAAPQPSLGSAALAVLALSTLPPLLAADATGDLFRLLTGAPL